ncbi:hypothetical protein E4U48_003959 [Claviceps purpurea]|nr:hypothetical protein E4U48_003959 [Claviceps purpurea]
MEDLLKTERTAYYRSDQQNQIGPEEKRQVDLFVKMNIEDEGRQGTLLAKPIANWPSLNSKVVIKRM